MNVDADALLPQISIIKRAVHQPFTIHIHTHFSSVKRHVRIQKQLKTIVHTCILLENVMIKYNERNSK